MPIEGGKGLKPTLRTFGNRSHMWVWSCVSTHVYRAASLQSSAVQQAMQCKTARFERYPENASGSRPHRCVRLAALGCGSIGDTVEHAAKEQGRSYPLCMWSFVTRSVLHIQRASFLEAEPLWRDDGWRQGARVRSYGSDRQLAAMRHSREDARMFWLPEGRTTEAVPS